MMQQKGGKLYVQRPETYVRFATKAHVTVLLLQAEWVQQVEQW